MMARFDDHPSLRFFIGDVRDRERLERAMHGVDVVVHAAALKQVPACEYNPFEAIQTNVIGAKNVIDAAIDQGVDARDRPSAPTRRCNPINLYGATKLCAEKLFVQGNAYGHPRGHACSRGALRQRHRQPRQRHPALRAPSARPARVTVTDRGDDALLDHASSRASSSPSAAPRDARRRDLRARRSRACGSWTWSTRSRPAARSTIIGIRPGEKLHEILISEDESRQALEFDDMFVHRAALPVVGLRAAGRAASGPAPGFRYSSDTNQAVALAASEMREMAG